MSSRNMRKVYGETTLPPPEDSSDEEPVYSKLKPSFQGLEVTSGSSASEQASSSEAEEAPSVPVRKNRNNKKKKKKTKTPAGLEPDAEDVDEVTHALQEVNQLLGEPSPVQSPAAPSCICTPPFMVVELRHIDSNNEMKRMFGPDEEDKKKKRARRSNIRLLKKFIVVPLEDYVDMFKPVGLTMSVSRKEGGVFYFTLDHGAEYQRMHRRFLDTAELRHAVQDAGVFLEAHRNHHVEAMVECADLFFSMEDNTNGSEFVTLAVAYLQYVAHPSFLPTDSTVRLEYGIPENRIFHIAVLKYLYLLTTKACHRTALELAKMLLNLDPGDPLAVILIIDTLALRAREHEWLLEAYQHWMRERDAEYMYNLRFSHALAKFHVLTKEKQDTSEATTLLENALLDFPFVCHQMLRATSQRMDQRLATHPLYDQPGHSTLSDLTRFYCHMSASKWNEPVVMKWFIKTCTDLAEKYDAHPEYQVRTQTQRQRRGYYNTMPDEVQRHFCIIKAMTELVSDNGVPPVPTIGRASDPRPPPATVDRYGYVIRGRETATAVSPLLEVVFRVLTSIDPRTVPPPPPEDYQ